LYTGTLVSWQLYQGTNTSIKTFDHTLKRLDGHYFALDFTELNKTNVVSHNYRVQSQVFPPTSAACVTFSYYMTGLTDNEILSFFMKKESLQGYSLTRLWFARGEQGPFWYNHRTTINSTLNWQIVFGIFSLNSKEGLIAIDDVLVEIDKPCPMQGRCDFEVRTFN
jgi:hypothetical protein